jgi:uncharacterized protein (DUF2252 family)
MSTYSMTHDERRLLGASRRKQLARRTHADWDPKHRHQDPLALLAASMQGRLPGLAHFKYQLMAQSPFSYFRGAVPVMAADLALVPSTGILNQLCGDAHVRNLGAYEAPDGRLVFDINDFDETIHAPFEWDLKRMAASLVLAGRESGSKEGACRDAVGEFVEAYAELMECLSELPVLEIARYQVHRLNRTPAISEVLAKAERATPVHNLEQLTIPATRRDTLLPGVLSAEGLRVFKQLPGPFPGAPPMLSRVPEADAHAALSSLTAYRESLLPERRHFFDQYRPIDVGFKVVGTGSVGLRDYVIYLEGNGPEDPLFLQIKEEVRSGWSSYIEKMDGHAHQPAHEGQRVAEGQRAMQLQSDPFLGWTTIENRPYLVRQLNDHKGSIDVEDLHGTGLEEYARICGELLARGHARSGDAVVLNGYVGRGGSLGKALMAFGVAYADQTERDQKELVKSRQGAISKPAHAAKPASRPAAAKGGVLHTLAAKSAPAKKTVAKKAVVTKTAAPEKRSGTAKKAAQKTNPKIAPKSKPSPKPKPEPVLAASPTPEPDTIA